VVLRAVVCDGDTNTAHQRTGAGREPGLATGIPCPQSGHCSG
jgi:hypothetical protein